MTLPEFRASGISGPGSLGRLNPLEDASGATPVPERAGSDGAAVAVRGAAGASAVPSLGPDSPGDALYRFDAPEIKAVNHRLDGAFWPHAAAAGTPEQLVVVLEVQMQGKAGFKHRLWAQTARFAQLHPQVQVLEVVVVVPHRRLRLGPDQLP
jgi:hypothetical protein